MITVTFNSVDAAERAIAALKKAQNLDAENLDTWEVKEEKTRSALKDRFLGIVRLTHKAEQYVNKGFIKVSDCDTSKVKFSVHAEDEELFAIYQGRFIQMLWSNFYSVLNRIDSDGDYQNL